MTQLKSFRTSHSSELIQEKETQALVSAEISLPTASRINLGLEGNKKSLRVDDKVFSSRAKYPFLGSSVTFSPDDLMLVKGGPEQRRLLMDELLVGIDPEKAILISRYQKVLKQRNSLLKSVRETGRGRDQLASWTIALIEAAIPLIEARIQLVRSLNLKLPKVYQQIFNTAEQLSVEYAHRLGSDIMSSSEIEAQLVHKLSMYAEAEIASGYTLVGPHKDDLEFRLNGMDVRTFGSQGQTRGLVIVLKIAQLELAREMRGNSPILLLDDIISELDDFRVDALVRYLAHYPGQLFVTTAEMKKVESLHLQFSDFKVIPLSNQLSHEAVLEQEAPIRSQLSHDAFARSEEHLFSTETV
jgi:DNA replication and repair protein RecF